MKAALLVLVRPQLPKYFDPIAKSLGEPHLCRGFRVEGAGFRVIAHSSCNQKVGLCAGERRTIVYRHLDSSLPVHGHTDIANSLWCLWVVLGLRCSTLTPKHVAIPQSEVSRAFLQEGHQPATSPSRIPEESPKNPVEDYEIFENHYITFSTQKSMMICSTFVEPYEIIDERPRYTCHRMIYRCYSSRPLAPWRGKIAAH